MGNAATLNIYAIKDNQTPCFPQMFFSISDADATRVCANLLRGDTQLSAFSEHFDLFCLGSVDQNSGFIDLDQRPDKKVGENPLIGPRFICGLVTLKTLIQKEVIK